MGKKPAARQVSPTWVNMEELPSSAGHPFFIFPSVRDEVGRPEAGDGDQGLDHLLRPVPVIHRIDGRLVHVLIEQARRRGRGW